MFRKHKLLVALIVVIGLVALRETVLSNSRAYQGSWTTLSNVKADKPEFTGPINRIIIRDELNRQADSGHREGNVLYVYVNAFVFDRAPTLLLPLYKFGRGRSYLSYEFVYNRTIYSGGIVGQQTRFSILGLRSVSEMYRSERQQLIEAIIKHHHLPADAPLAFER